MGWGQGGESREVTAATPFYPAIMPTPGGVLRARPRDLASDSVTGLGCPAERPRRLRARGHDGRAPGRFRRGRTCAITDAMYYTIRL